MPGLEISGRLSYFATINFDLTTMTLNVVLNLTPGFFTFMVPLALNWLVLISSPEF